MEGIKEYLDCGLIVDLSQMPVKPNNYEVLWEEMLEKMNSLEKGEICNPGESRRVGHYWLRNPLIAPIDVRDAILRTLSELKDFANKIHSGEIVAKKGKKFKQAIIIGIGGSSLGPRFLSEALSGKKDLLELYFMDNTDPDGIEAILEKIG